MAPTVERKGPSSTEWSRGPSGSVKWKVAGLAGRWLCLEVAVVLRMAATLNIVPPVQHKLWYSGRGALPLICKMERNSCKALSALKTIATHMETLWTSSPLVSSESAPLISPVCVLSGLERGEESPWVPAPPFGIKS